MRIIKSDSEIQTKITSLHNAPGDSDLDTLQKKKIADLMDGIDKFVVGTADGFESNKVGEKIKQCRLDGTALLATLSNAKEVLDKDKTNPLKWGDIIKVFASALEEFTSVKAECLSDDSIITQLGKDVYTTSYTNTLWFDHVAQ